jgi:hypothetical protein
VTIFAVFVKGVFCGNLGVLGMAINALLSLLAFLRGVMALLALGSLRMLLVVKRNPLVFIRRVKPGIVDGDGIRLAEDAL